MKRKYFIMLLYGMVSIFLQLVLFGVAFSNAESEIAKPNESKPQDAKEATNDAEGNVYKFSSTYVLRLKNVVARYASIFNVANAVFGPNGELANVSRIPRPERLDIAKLAPLWRIPADDAVALICAAGSQPGGVILFQDLYRMPGRPEIAYEALIASLDSAVARRTGIFCAIGSPAIDERLVLAVQKALESEPDLKNDAISRLLFGIWRRSIRPEEIGALVDALGADETKYIDMSVGKFVTLAYRLGQAEIVAAIDDHLAGKLPRYLKIYYDDCYSTSAKSVIDTYVGNIRNLASSGRRNAALAVLKHRNIVAQNWRLEVVDYLQSHCAMKNAPEWNINVGDALHGAATNKKAVLVKIERQESFFLSDEFIAAEWDPILSLWVDPISKK